MEAQTFINILLGLCAFFGGIWVRGIADSMRDLKSADIDLAEKVQKIEILVAGDYVRREEIDKLIDRLAGALFTKLDRIELKLDGKVDK